MFHNRAQMVRPKRFVRPSQQRPFWIFSLAGVEWLNKYLQYDILRYLWARDDRWTTNLFCPRPSNPTQICRSVGHLFKSWSLFFTQNRCDAHVENLPGKENLTSKDCTNKKKREKKHPRPPNCSFFWTPVTFNLSIFVSGSTQRLSPLSVDISSSLLSSEK